jgi:acetylornithine/N-succinyldiaminopimelate aminotransferase
VTMALEARLLINVTQDSVIRLLPPLIIQAHEADEIVARLAPCVRQFAASARQAA